MSADPIPETSPDPPSSASPRAPTVAHFLRLFEYRDLYRASPADHLRIERLLRSREPWTVGQMAAALASLLATDKHSWTAIHDLSGPGKALRETTRKY